MYLLDTVILSELRRKRREPAVTAWVSKQHPSDIYLSVITVGEIERGIAQQQTKNPEFAETLDAWLNAVMTLYSDRILGVNTAIAKRWGRLSASMGNAGADLMIAATALEHGLTVVTRNIRHFQPTGVSVVNPFTTE